MPLISITNLNDTYQYFNPVYDTGITRSNNLITWAHVRGTVAFVYDTESADIVPFDTGDKVRLNYIINGWDDSTYCRIYARGIPPTGGNTTGFANWAYIKGPAGIDSSYVGSDANHAVRTRVRGRVELEIVFTAPTRGFRFFIAPVDRSGATVAGSGTITFELIHSNTEVDDPYASGGVSTSGGGDGTFDFSSTDIEVPNLPTIGAYDTGFLTLYSPTTAQMKNLASYMWANTASFENLRKLVADPMDVILGLSIMPGGTGDPSTISSELVVGNISTGLSMPKITSQFYEVDCGEITVLPKWGAYLDYHPYSKLQLFLPYIGYVDIQPDDCMGGTIKVTYHIDILSGTCCAFVYCRSNRGVDGHVLYTFNGSCGTQCPITSGQYASIFEVAANMVGIGAKGAILDATPSISNAVNALKVMQSNVVDSIKPNVSRSGAFGSSSGLMGIQYPYLILTVPHMCIPGDQNVYIGYPSFVTKTMGDLEGYNELEITHMNNMSCTDEEVQEIIKLLGEGVIF